MQFVLKAHQVQRDVGRNKVLRIKSPVETVHGFFFFLALGDNTFHHVCSFRCTQDVKTIRNRIWHLALDRIPQSLCLSNFIAVSPVWGLAAFKKRLWLHLGPYFWCHSLSIISQALNPKADTIAINCRYTNMN